MELKYTDRDLQFLAGDGEMSKLTRDKDWNETSLGPPESWPQSLRTSLSIILNSRFPMFLFWGKDLICFYNDAYRPSLGKEGKHPYILGMKGEDAWTEIWHIIKPLIDQVLSGGSATWSEDQLIPIYRNGKIEDVYWTFSYSPVNDESGKPAGVFVTCTETTEKVFTYKKIEESKRELEFAIEATELGTWDLNPFTNKLSSNTRLKKWFGLPMEEQAELTQALNVIHEKDRERVTNAIQKALDFSSGGNYDIEYTIVNPNTKKEIIVHAKGRAWFNNENLAYRFNGTLEDITQKAATAKQIKESEVRYHHLIHSSPSAIGILYGEDMVITIANEAIIKIWGKGKEIIGKPYFEALPELADQGYKDIFANVFKTGIPFNAVETPVHILQNGELTLKYYNFLLFPQRNLNNEVEGVGIIATEVTSQAILNNRIKESEQKYRELSILLEEKVKKRTEELQKTNEILRASEERYHRMVEEVQDYAIILLSTEGIILNWNKGAENIKGYAAGEIVGKSFSTFYTEEDRSNHIPEKLLALAAKKGKATDENWRVRKDGSRFWGSVIITALRDDKRNIIGFVKVTRDLTERKNSEDRLKQTAAMLKQKNIDLEKMNKELQSFAYISSHDLQEPLRKIQTFATRIIATENDHLTDGGKDMFQRMQLAALRMQKLIDDLLSYSRTNTADRIFVKTDLNKIVEEVKSELKEELKQKNATVESGGLCEVKIIPFQFKQLLHNLFGNSIKFSVSDRPLHIKIKSEMAPGAAFKNDKLAQEKMYCQLTVSDNGIGFEQEYSDKIFELFQRLHGRAAYGGTGIGLAIVKKIVDNHEGVISATSELDKGAAFEIYIPV